MWNLQQRFYELIHTGERPYNCEQCEVVSFKTKGDLKSHMRVHGGVERWEFPCNQCQKKFTKMSSLKTHTLLHTGEKPLKCSKCDKSFTQQGHLRSHARRAHKD